MRNTIFLLILGVLQAHAIDTYSQKTKLSLDFTNTELITVLDNIEKESDFFFLYNEKLLNLDRKVSITENNQLISVILDDLFAGTDVKYTIIDRKIILAPDYLTEPSEQQQRSITGIVKDENGYPLPGVNIQVEGTVIGAISDVNGKYSIEIKNDNAVLIFSFIGYNTQKITVSGRTSIDIALVPLLTTLEEIIVIGYGTVKKSDLTGSVGSVSSDKLVAFPTTNVLQSLQGKVAGLTITSNNGAPGSTSTIRIRGGSSISTNSEPLWVVDGFPGAPQPQAEDIQSIEVLRDASACAIYGSRGSNGVILVTTKKGTGTLRVEANTSYTIMQVSKKLDVLNGKDYAKFVNDFTKTVSPTAPPVFNPDTIGAGTNWQDVIFRTGALQTYQVSVSGGSDKVKVYSSAKYSKEDGIIINNSSDFFTGKLNVDANVSDKTMVGAHMDYGHWTYNNVSSQSFYTGYGGMTSTALGFEPTLGIYQADGITYTTAQRSFGGTSDNPYANAVEPQRQNIADNFSTNMYLDYELLKGLKFYTSLAVQLGSDRDGTSIPTTIRFNVTPGVGYATLHTNRDINLNSTTYLTYDKTFAGIHKLTVMVGHDYQSFNHEEFQAGAGAFPDNSFSYWNLGSGTATRTPQSGTYKWFIESWYGRLNYTLKDKYLLTFMGREDGSSRFGEKHKWGFFPSVSARWNISKESFIQSIGAISQLDLHAGYGTNGNTGLGAYSSLAQLTASGIYAFVNGARVGAVMPTSVANAQLGWETSKMTNIGLDLGLFNGRINFAAEWYNRESSNMLYFVPLPNYSGYTNMWQNFGDFRNRGIEFTLGGNLSGGDFDWSSDFNISFNKATVVKLPGSDLIAGPSPLNNDRTFILREGESPNSFWGLIYEGVDPSTGLSKYADINGVDADGKLTGQPDGKIDASDRTIIGNANPKFTYGWVNNFRYKGFDLNLAINGSYGNKILNATRIEMETMRTPNNTTPAYFDAWTPTHTNTNVPLAGSEAAYVYSSRWIEDGSYLRVQNIALGFTFPSSVVKMLRINKCRFYVSVQNALLLTKYKGYDPEVFWNPQGGAQNSNIFRGMDYDAYPHTRNYTIGIQVTF